MNKSLMMYQIFITPLNPPDVLGMVRVGYNCDKINFARWVIRHLRVFISLPPYRVRERLLLLQLKIKLLASTSLKEYLLLILSRLLTENNRCVVSSLLLELDD